jgi:type II secretory pathway predicted ATPase ExeA
MVVMAVFKQHFGMKSNPFDKEVDSADLYVGGDARELGSRLKYMLDLRGIFLLIGEPGSGKTTELRRFTDNLGPSLYRPFYIKLTTVTVNDFLSGLASELGEEPLPRKIGKFNQIQSVISSLYFEQRVTPVIVADEMHMASSDILDDIRMLFNFRMDSVNPYVLIIAAQPAIKTKLAINTGLPLKQRIANKYTMKGLSEPETHEYIKSRMALAGVTRDVFTDQAITQIHSASSGFPRNINNIANACLMYCKWKNLEQADEEVVYQANKELAL